FRGDAPFFLHNADILTELPLERLAAAHAPDALATLAVMERPTSRYLLFDDEGLVGRVDERKSLRFEMRPTRGEVRPLAFAGVHFVSPAIWPLVQEQVGIFSILDVYLAAVAAGKRIDPFRADS